MIKISNLYPNHYQTIIDPLEINDPDFFDDSICAIHVIRKKDLYSDHVNKFDGYYDPRANDQRMYHSVWPQTLIVEKHDLDNISPSCVSRAHPYGKYPWC